MAGAVFNLSTLRQRFESIEPSIHAFLDEPGRFDRIQRDIASAEVGPLTGIWLGVKDIIRVDGLPTRAGSQLPPEVFAGPEAPCVTLLKQAGAVVVGKTVTTEFAYFAPGPTRNPHNLEHTPGGSSSGSAAAVAAGICDLALGSQTGGSTIRPAAFCGIVGFKPTYERIDSSGLVPFAPSVDTVGLFARDVALIIQASTVLCRSWHPVAPPRSITVGIPDGPYLQGASVEGLAHFEAVVASLRAAGLNILRVPAMPDHADIAARHQDLMAAEMAQTHRDWFPQYGHTYRPQTVKMIQDGQRVTAARLAYARAGRAKLRDDLHRLMDAHHLDAWVCPPALGPAPHSIDATGSPAMNVPWTHAGLPALSLPAGRNAAGLPLGLQLTTRSNHDESLLAIASILAPLLTPE